MSDRLDHVHSTNSITKCRERRGSRTGSSDWTTVFRELGDQLDSARAPFDSPGGPGELALTVVAEALAVAVALGETLGTAPTGTDQANTSAKSAPEAGSAAIYADIDSRYLDHRARALRSALHSVDDYIWWGGLGNSQ